MSEIRAACEQDHASPAHLKAFTTKPDTFPHHDWVLCQRLSAALRAPAQTLQTVLDTSLDNLLRNRQLNLLLNVDSHTTRLRIPLGFAAHSSRVPWRQPTLWLCPRSCWSPSAARQTERRTTLLRLSFMASLPPLWSCIGYARRRLLLLLFTNSYQAAV